MSQSIGVSVPRKEAWAKVTGEATYTDDISVAGMLVARLLTATCASARIRNIDTSQACALEGVKAVLTGDLIREQFGPLLLDRPALAREYVRYAGEPVAMAIAVDKPTAEAAVNLIRVDYEPQPFVLTPSAALAPGAHLVHGDNSYRKVMEDVYPQPGTNIASSYKIRKGNAEEVLRGCEVIVEKTFSLPPSDHVAMEVHTARAEISREGVVSITSSTQSPYSIVKQLSSAFMIPAGKIRVKVPFVGGGFGGKAPVTLEILAYLASRAVNGKPVRVTIPRELDMATMPCRMGLDATVRLGADKDGVLKAAALTFYLDCGAYTDISPYMTKAIATDCTGPYRVEDLSCDAVCVYTNHTYVTSYRSFAHESCSFCIERTLDMLARKCGIDPLELRLKNAIRPGDKTPSQTICTPSLIGDPSKCIQGVRELSQWCGGAPIPLKPHIVRAMGVSCFWKTPNPPTNAISGAFVTFNPDGSMNLCTGIVEMGSGGQTNLAQMLAEKLGIGPDMVHIVYPVDTSVAPEHWKTVASMTEYMAGHAVVRAAEDIINQLRENGAQALHCPNDEIEVANCRVFSKKDPERFIDLKDIVQGYKSTDNESIGEPVLGRGSFMLKGLSTLDPETGAGKTGPAWTPGAQVVEIEADLRTYTYRLISACTVMDVGKVINPELMRAMVAGGMAMGISMASREAFTCDECGIPRTPNLRTYKLMHIGQEPDYRVAFVETPDESSPYGVRNYSEHGLIGIPAALANALSIAFGMELTTLPAEPEMIWRMAMRERANCAEQEVKA